MEYKRIPVRQALAVYFICGTQDCPHDSLATIETALRSGVTMFQLREKGQGSLTGDAKRIFAKKVQQLCKTYDVPFLVNDDIDLALELDADGIHIGQDDMDIAEARQLFPDKIIGLSVGNEEEYRQSNVALADYIGTGPVYPTISKDDASPATGTAGIASVRQLDKTIPIVGIGGITAGNAADVIRAGADGVSVISAISRADNVSCAVKALREAVYGVLEK
ncbi:thiamine phosphate synthase [uncultured Veillonella sp.]|uniref:thiamine phosphate synthase n=1 Tax=uncultured Veillonella sp. TaxID=159268 RepID=UPI00259A690E|nr:thiamine phosphate synthase [uncultured Veillonella sp.]